MFFRTVLLVTLGLIACCHSASAQIQFPQVNHYEPPPLYPPVARAVRAAGEVKVALEVNEKGKVVQAKAIDGHPLLRKVSELAALKWEFASVPGTHFLVIRFLFHDPLSKKERTGLEILGPYRVRFTGAYVEIIDTPSYSANK